MSSLPLVYIHGAGPQAPVTNFKREADRLIFGKDMPSTRVGYYANVRWPAVSGGGTVAAPARASRARRVKAIRSAMEPEITADAAADAIVAATLITPTPRRRGAAAAAAAAPQVSAADLAKAKSLVEQLYQEADRIANRSPRPRSRGTALNITFPDPIFRFVVGKFASDVIDYLYGPFKAPMREPVKKALLATPAPRIVVAHSLGTIITYDVLTTTPELANLKLDLLFTLGCPLGIGNVQQLVRDRAGRPNPIPAQLTAWSNYSDPFDPVALEHTLTDEFAPKNFARDEEVNNQARNNHDLTGYLEIPLIARGIAAAAG